MKKDLPGIYANKVDKKIETNKSYSITKKDDEIKKEKEDVRGIKLGMNINQKIQNIFNSPKYVYKADVIITTKDGKITKKIIGKTNNNLITMDNELINISDIKDINFFE